MLYRIAQTVGLLFVDVQYFSRFSLLFFQDKKMSCTYPIELVDAKALHHTRTGAGDPLGEETVPSRVMIAVDGSTCSNRAVDFASTSILRYA